MKEKKISGKSCSKKNLFGERKLDRTTGKKLSPKSLRAKFKFCSEVPNEIKSKFGINFFN